MHQSDIHQKWAFLFECLSVGITLTAVSVHT